MEEGAEQEGEEQRPEQGGEVTWRDIVSFAQAEVALYCCDGAVKLRRHPSAAGGGQRLFVVNGCSAQPATAAAASSPDSLVLHPDVRLFEELLDADTLEEIVCERNGRSLCANIACGFSFASKPQAPPAARVKAVLPTSNAEFTCCGCKCRDEMLQLVRCLGGARYGTSAMARLDDPALARCVTALFPQLPKEVVDKVRLGDITVKEYAAPLPLLGTVGAGEEEEEEGGDMSSAQGCKAPIPLFMRALPSAMRTAITVPAAAAGVDSSERGAPSAQCPRSSLLCNGDPYMQMLSVLHVCVQSELQRHFTALASAKSSQGAQMQDRPDQLLLAVHLPELSRVLQTAGADETQQQQQQRISTSSSGDAVSTSRLLDVFRRRLLGAEGRAKLLLRITASQISPLRGYLEHDVLRLLHVDGLQTYVGDLVDDCFLLLFIVFVFAGSPFHTVCADITAACGGGALLDKLRVTAPRQRRLFSLFYCQ